MRPRSLRAFRNPIHSGCSGIQRQAWRVTLLLGLRRRTDARSPLSRLRSVRCGRLNVRFFLALQAVGPVKQFHRVKDLDLPAVPVYTVPDLQDAAGIAGGHHVGRSLPDVVHLAREQPVRHGGMGNVVNAGAAAAPVRFLQFDEFETGNQAQQVPWLLADALAVGEVTGVVIGDPGPDGSHRPRLTGIPARNSCTSLTLSAKTRARSW